jgi:WS/DGAT/MGAT family acyltransferase
MSELFAIAEPIAMQGFDRARPLWELTVVEGLADGRAAVVAKIHHTITDGIGALRLQDELLDAERAPRVRPEDDMPAPPAAPGGRRLADAMTDEALRQVRGARGAATSALSSVGRLREDPVGVATGAVRNLASVARMLAPAVEPMSPLLAGRSLSVRFGRLDLPQAPLETAARLVSGRLNDSIVAGLAGGLARYHQHCGHDDVHAVRLAMPLDRLEDRSHPRGAAVTERFAPMRFTVPLDIDDALERLAAIRLLVDRERSEPGLGLSAPLANLVNRLPATATTALFGSLVRGVDVIAAHAPGPAGPAYLAGAAVEAQVAFAPLAGAGVAVAWVADGDAVNLGVSMDPAAVTDPDALLDCLTDGYDEILKLV